MASPSGTSKTIVHSNGPPFASILRKLFFRRICRRHLLQTPPPNPNRQKHWLPSKCRAASLIITLTGIVGIPSNFVAQDPSRWAMIGLAIAFAAFAGMVGLAIWAWLPTNFYVPGTLDRDSLYDDVISLYDIYGYDQILQNVLDCAQDNQAVNERKANLIKASAVLFILQILGLFVMALTS